MNAVTQTPINRTLVLSVDQRMAVMTDDKGRFEFEMKAPASHTLPAPGLPGTGVAYLVAKKPGYLFKGPPFPLLFNDQSPLKTEVRLQLMPEATVSGLVTASGADAPSGLTVQLLRRQVQDGAAVWTQVDAREADVRGRYRFAGLMPGEYKVVTGEWVAPIGPYPSLGSKPIPGYPPEAFPNGSSPATAEIIHVNGGQSIEADINLRAAPYYSVEVPVLNNSRADAVMVFVESENGPGYSLGFNKQTQRVEGALPDGVYHLSITESSGFQEFEEQSDRVPKFLVGSEELIVAGKPLQGNPIKLLPGVTIPVAVREEYIRPDPDQQSVDPGAHQTVAAPVETLDGTQSATPPQEHQAATLQDIEGKVQHPRTVEVFLVAGDRNQGGLGLRNSADDQGNEGLVIDDVSPGSYRVKINSRRGYVASATANGVNLLREPLVIAPGAASPSISIVLRDDTGTITGTFSSDAAKEAAPLPSHSVWAYPLEGDEAAQPVVGPEGTDGKFTINGVVPGRYLVLASQAEFLNLEYRNRDVMKAYESKGVIVNISAGQSVNVELKQAVTDDSWPEAEAVID